MQRAYPITKTMAVYVLSSDIVNRELAYMENIIKTYAPDYSYEEMEYDHQMTQYESTTLSTPVFRLSLEYTLSEDGLVVTLPANGIRFDETLYKLQNITVLPYMGAGTYTNEGYTFIPDGSGALMDYADFAVLVESGNFVEKVCHCRMLSGFEHDLIFAVNLFKAPVITK